MWTQTNKLIATIAAIFAAITLNTTWAQLEVQPNEGEGENNLNRGEVIAKMRALQEQGEQIQAKLREVEEKAMNQEPRLVEMQNDLMEVYQSKLEENGYPTDEELEELRQLQVTLQNPENLEEDERKALTAKFQAQVTALQQAQQKAQQDPALQEAYQKLEMEKLEAMSEIDSDVPAMREQEAKTQQQIQQLQQHLQRAN